MSYKDKVVPNYDYIHLAPKITYNLLSSLSSSIKAERRIRNSHYNQDRIIAPANLRVEAGVKYQPSKKFDAELLVSSQLYDPQGNYSSEFIKKNYLVELNVNLLAF
ncbi:MAG: hypothetical protein HQK53_12600 [Oligoflexia bacterium]|nr:hypothetical protein [Oligoflexia bacterium]